MTVWTRCLPVVSVRSSCKWGKVCKNGLCKFCGRQPLKNLLSPFLNTLSHMLIFHDSPVWILRLSCLITWRQNYIKIWTMLSLEWWSPFVLKFLKITFEQFATNFVVFRVILYGLFLDCFFFLLTLNTALAGIIINCRSFCWREERKAAGPLNLENFDNLSYNMGI